MVKRKSIVLLSVMIILLTIALIGASLVAFFSSVNINTQTTADETKALYLAEAGIARAVSTLRGQASGAGELERTLGPFGLGEGVYSVIIDLNQSLITSKGSVRGVTKTIQLQFNAL